MANIRRDWKKWLVEFMEYENDSIAEFLRTKGIQRPANYVKQTGGWHEVRNKFWQQRLEAKQKNIIKDDEERTGLYRKLIKATLQQEALLLQSNIKYNADGKPAVKNAILPNIASQVIERCLKCDRLMSGESTENVATNLNSAVLELLHQTKDNKIIDMELSEIDSLPMANVQIKNDINRNKENIREQAHTVADAVQSKD